jgi:hypothetical protein
MPTVTNVAVRNRQPPLVVTETVEEVARKVNSALSSSSGADTWVVLTLEEQRKIAVRAGSIETIIERSQ